MLALGILGPARQVGHLPAVHTDASLGFSVVASQPKRTGFDRSAGEERVLLLLDGNICRGRQASESAALALRREAGFCPGCVVATYVAAPPIFQRGCFSEAKALGMSVRQQHGPRAVYAQTYYSLSRNWDWAARNFETGTRLPAIWPNIPPKSFFLNKHWE